MSKKKSAAKSLVRNAKAATRETKKQGKNVAASVKAAAKFVRSITSRGGKSGKPTPKKSTKAPSGRTKPSKTKTVKSASVKSPLEPGRDSYQLTELASGKTLASLYANLEENAQEIDRLKPPGARWAFRIFGRQSLRPYRSMTQVLEKIGYLASTEELNPDIIGNMSFITIGGSPKEYQEMRQGEQAELKRENEETEREAAKVVGRKHTDGRNKTKIEVIRDLLKHDKNEKEEKRKEAARRKAAEKRAAEADKRAAEAEARLLAIEKRFAKLERKLTTPKKGKKTVAKKAAKKTAKKSATKKNSTKPKKVTTKSSVSRKSVGQSSGRNKTKKPKKGKKK